MQKCILSQFWRLWVQSQGVSSTTLPLKAPERMTPLPLPSSSWWLPASLGVLWLVTAYVQPLLHPHLACSLCIPFILFACFQFISQTGIVLVKYQISKSAIQVGEFTIMPMHPADFRMIKISDDGRE